MSYLEEARERAQRRRSPWNLLLIPFVVGVLIVVWYGLVRCFVRLHAGWYPADPPLSKAGGIGTILVAVSPFFASLPAAMLAANLVVHSISSARRALDAEAAGYPGTSYLESQRQLLIVSLIFVPISLLLATLGAALHWSVWTPR